MPRQAAPIEQTTFARGLITEASPLTFPPDASVDEKNFIILRDGTRRRRLGLDFETDYASIDSGVVPTASNKVVTSSFNWNNAGGDPDSYVSVVQIGPVLKFFDPMQLPVSGNLIYTYDTGVSNEEFLSFTVVDGVLVVATGEKEILTFSYSDGTITQSTVTLKVRDLFGTEDYSGSDDLTSGSGLYIRPSSLTDNHRYNLRNQSFNVPRLQITGAISEDTLSSFTAFYGTFPSNSDAVHYNLYPNPLASDKTVERFFPGDLLSNPPGSFPAAKGYFIIDALERGPSREVEYAKLLSEFSELTYPLTSLSADTTPGGASSVEEYSGRVWYAGFSGSVIDGDEKSPKLSSYVMFSQLVEDPSDIAKCYQEADPTSAEASEIVATDGGFIRLAGAYGIVGMKSMGDSLMVIAANGVWRIFGGDTGFSATDYVVEKITNRGCSSPNSIIVAGNTMLYLANDGIYSVAPNEYGDYAATNLTLNTIQSYYDDISTTDKLYAYGTYDSFTQKAMWLFGNNLISTEPVIELVLDIPLGAFYPIELASISGNRPRPVCMLTVPPFKTGQVQDSVTVGGISVESATDPVVVTSTTLEEGFRELVYITLLDDSVSGSLQFTVSSYTDTSFLDWYTYDSVGIDAAAYLVTGYLTGGDTQRKKDINYLTIHFVRTEDGFEDDGFGGLTPTNPSGCKIQTQWEWTNSANSNRWGKEFQAYRYKRLYLPSDINDPYDTGHLVITTKNRLRGRGRALSMLMKTEAGKDCRILGWAMIAGVAGNV